MRKAPRGPTQWHPTRLKLNSRNLLKIEHGGLGSEVRVEIPFFTLVGKVRNPRALLIAGVHGDEYEGVAVLQEVAEEIDPRGLKGTLTIVPVANPQAFHAGTRRNPIDLGDLNRSFPGNPAGTVSERLAYLLFHELVVGNTGVLSMHCWSKEATAIPYVEYPDERSTVGRKSFRAAMALGLEFLHPYQWHRGLLVACAVRTGIPAIEPEVGGMGTLTPAGQRTYREIVYRFLHHLGMLKTGACPDAVVRPKIVQHTDCLAKFAGLFRSRVSPGQVVAQDEILGTVHDLAGRRREEVRAPRAGTVAILRTFSSVMPGDRLVQIFSERSPKRAV